MILRVIQYCYMYRLDTKTEGSMAVMNARALGCGDPSTMSALLGVIWFINAVAPKDQGV